MVDDPPRLWRFNVHELRNIEKALAQHLHVDISHVDQEGFTVVPDSEGMLRITWRASAPIAIDDFQSIVDEVTAEQTGTGPQPRPGAHAPVPKITRQVLCRARAKPPRAPGG